MAVNRKTNPYEKGTASFTVAPFHPRVFVPLAEHDLPNAARTGALPYASVRPGAILAGVDADTRWQLGQERTGKRTH